VLQGVGGGTFGSNNVDHHRTGDSTALIGALGEHAAAAALTMEQLYQSKAVLVIGNDPSKQNPLVAWQIRAGIRHFDSKLFLVNSKEIKLKRKASQFVQVAQGQEAAAVRWLATGEGQMASGAAEKLAALKAALEPAPELAIVFGSEITGSAIRDLVAFGSKLQGKVRYMALGDYANSRGAADMGVLPDRLPGYAYLDNKAAAETLAKYWNTLLPTKPGMTTCEMVEAAQSGKLKALYVMGANPFAHFAKAGAGRGQLGFLVVHEMFLTETAQLADVVFPAASAYEKDGSVTNTAGEIQLLRKDAEGLGTRSDFDLLRILPHQLERLGLGKAFHCKPPAAVFEEIRKTVPGYDVHPAGLLTGGAEPTKVASARNGHGAYDVPVQAIRPANDNLFSSGTLGRFCTTMQSLPEAEAKP